MDFVVFSKKKKVRKVFTWGKFNYFAQNWVMTKEKEGLQLTNSDGFCGVLQRTKKGLVSVTHNIVSALKD